jgi:hypothetical protein
LLRVDPELGRSDWKLGFWPLPRLGLKSKLTDDKQ